MSEHRRRFGLLRTRWAAVGAAVAVGLGAGGIGIGHATTSSGEKPIFLPIEPCRLVDTRPAFQVGQRSAALGPNETYDLSGWGNVGECTLPTNTAGLALNVTPVGPTAPTFLTVFPDGAPLPNASNLNPTPGQPPTPNAVNVDLSAAGRFSVYNLAGNVHIVIDVVGIYDDHTHDDRYYTKSEVDSRAANADLLDGLHANELVRAAFGSSSNVVDANGNAVTATITAPRPGILVMGGSVEAFGETYDSWGCRLDVNGSIVSGSSMFSSTNYAGAPHTRNYNEDCSTDGAQVVAAGTHNVSLNIYLRESVGLFEASVWVMYVPFDGNGTAPAAPMGPPLVEPASDRRFEVDEADVAGS